MRIIFMGSPTFATPSLKALHERYEICAVITQPDRPAGRGRSLRESAVKKLAASHSLPILQPENLKDNGIYRDLSDFKADLIVVASFGQILPERILNLPKYGSINVHASLLPRWRGAAPIQASIVEGDERTGVTIMKMDAGLDTGPIIDQRSTPISEDETGGELESRLAVLGSQLIRDTIPGYISGEIVPSPQDDSLATYAPMLKKKDGQIDPGFDAARLSRQVRAYEPWPTSFFFWNNLRIVVRSARSMNQNIANPGEVFIFEGAPAIATIDGSLVLETIQPAGKREMKAADFLNGSPDFIGSIIND
jgi:methionyl-tRNA formyltransferase